MTETERFSPRLSDLVATVRDFLKELAPQLERGPAYESQVARYLLDMSLRELDRGANLDSQTRARFGTLLDAAAVGIDPIAALARAIRGGTLDARWDEVLGVVLDDTIERVAIIRPDVLSPEHAAQRGARVPSQ